VKQFGLRYNTVYVCSTTGDGTKCDSSRHKVYESTVSVSGVRINAVVAELEHYKVKQQFTSYGSSVKCVYNCL